MTASSSINTRALFDLTGRRAIVTGGAGLLGARFAAALLDVGATVHLLDHDGDAAARVAAELSTSGHCLPAPCDITSEADVARCIDAIAASGAIDVLVNSAAVNPKAEPADGAQGGVAIDDVAFTDYPVERWRLSMDVNLTGMFLVTQAVCRHFERTGVDGVIVNISSTYGMAGPDQRLYERADGTRSFKPLDYSVSKAGVLGFTKALAANYRGSGIRVNALTPGGAFNDHDDEFVQAYSSRTILDRMARPDEYRGAIAFLCSDASSYMTGANLVVDGGWTAW
ncbi:MAG: SDR family oxidoreductase [Acidimicrobiia bacterium]|nr:SDR family oxidoreductase [Acidimicrobiia bacterium]